MSFVVSHPDRRSTAAEDVGATERGGAPKDVGAAESGGAPDDVRAARSPAVRVKVCCIASPEEAALAVRHGASALGLVSRMPSGPGVIEEAMIREIVDAVPSDIDCFLLTALTDVAAIADQQRRSGAGVIQLVDRVAPETYGRLRAELPGVRLVQVIHVTGPDALAAAVEVAPEVDALLLDSGRPDLPIKELGGTGRTHDWEISRRIRRAVEVPMFLAGGLAPGNVREAVERVSPYGVDVCSGLRPNGRLDEGKLRAFMRALGVSDSPGRQRQ